MFSLEEEHANIIVSGFTWNRIAPTIYQILDEHANHYIAEMVSVIC